MVDRLPVWLFLSIAMILMGSALFPIVRVGIGIDAVPAMQPWTVVMLLIGGLMSGLIAMILMVRRQPKIKTYDTEIDTDKPTILKLHASGLLILTGIPLLNFLVCFWLWTQNRPTSKAIDQQGKEALNFQITIYLYLLMALFLTMAIIGFFAIPLILLFHFLTTLFAIYQTSIGKTVHYPANIPIIQGRPRGKPYTG